MVSSTRFLKKYYPYCFAIGLTIIGGTPGRPCSAARENFAANWVGRPRIMASSSTPTTFATPPTWFTGHPVVFAPVPAIDTLTYRFQALPPHPLHDCVPANPQAATPGCRLRSEIVPTGLLNLLASKPRSVTERLASRIAKLRSDGRERNRQG